MKMKINKKKLLKKNLVLNSHNKLNKKMNKKNLKSMIKLNKFLKIKNLNLKFLHSYKCNKIFKN